MLAAARFLGARIGPYPDFRAFLDAHWADVSRMVLTRATQTNEAGRCATLLPSLAQIAAAGGRPLALLEVGASAGLNLFPDRYGYEYDAGARGHPAGPGRRCSRQLPGPGLRRHRPGPAPGGAPSGGVAGGNRPQPPRCPEPRRRRLAGGADLAGAGLPPRAAAPGDRRGAGRPAPPGGRGPQRPARRPGRAGAVGRHAGGLPQRGPGLPRCGGPGPVPRHHGAARRRTGCHWLSNEGHTVILQADGSSVVPEMDDERLRGRFLLLHNGKPVAITGPHGQSLEWL